MDGAILPGRVDPLRDLARSFAEGAAEHDREGSFPHGNIAALRDAGLLGFTVPRELGGAEIGLERAVEVVGTIAEGCPATALVLAIQFIQQRGIARNPAVSPAIRERLGRGAVQRGEVINALRVEPELGTPARGGLPASIARRVPGGWALSGRKIYSTGSPALSWGLVWARTDEETPRTGLFLLPMKALGVRIVETWDQAGLRASGSHDVLFNAVTLPEDHALELRAPDAWTDRDLDAVAWNTLLVAALYTGVARAARDWLIGFLRSRVPANLGKPLATLPRVQEAVGRIEALILTNERLIAGAARDETSATQLGLVKTVAADNAIAAVQEAVALCGNHALARSNPLERHLRDVLCARIHTPQPDAALLAAGRAALLTI
ncbi:acyl-CoA dehydrogenase family protein [Roseomonas xinghualingensis]|uniref:acyl-CoA dehydrogenase family protein n=1 Tax=Roseomonas xinghualingensis TaxID=2986475 RepID=UPI0021F1B597|nr:acyl-CoA dehydrogenase family protein [Roseomonas sp. SXEYE001]MCV4207237.1 acyl-CoA/acyl-ACP dehydrogenase [Roseomonas sp. SXEYE001]